MRDQTRRRYVKGTATALSLGTFGLAGCLGEDGDGDGDNNNGADDTGDAGDSDGSNTDDNDDNGEDLFDDSINTLISSSEGGGLDRTTREIQSYYEELIDTNLRFEYYPGETVIAFNELLQQESNGHNILVTNEFGYAFTIADNDDLNPEEFVSIGNLIADFNVYRIHQDEDRFETIEEIIDYARDNPGELNVSVPGVTNRNSLTSVLVEEETGADFNHVPYDGGSEARTALSQREVDMVNASVFNSLPWAEDTKVVAVFADENLWPDLTDDAPTFNDALDVDLPTNAIAGRYHWMTTAEDQENHPDRIEALQDALGEAATNEEYLGDLAEADPPEDGKVFYMDPEETAQANAETLEIAENSVALIEEEFQ